MKKKKDFDSYTHMWVLEHGRGVYFLESMSVSTCFWGKTMYCPVHQPGCNPKIQHTVTALVFISAPCEYHMSKNRDLYLFAL